MFYMYNIAWFHLVVGNGQIGYFLLRNGNPEELPFQNFHGLRWSILSSSSSGHFIRNQCDTFQERRDIAFFQLVKSVRKRQILFEAYKDDINYKKK